MFRARRGETVATGWDVDTTGADVKWVECLISDCGSSEVKRLGRTLRGRIQAEAQSLAVLTSSAAPPPPLPKNSLWVVPLIMWQLGRLIVCKRQD